MLRGSDPNSGDTIFREIAAWCPAAAAAKGLMDSDP